MQSDFFHLHVSIRFLFYSGTYFHVFCKKKKPASRTTLAIWSCFLNDQMLKLITTILLCKLISGANKLFLLGFIQVYFNNDI